MNPIKDDIAKASKQIGLTDSQADNLWQALQEIQINKPKPSFLTALLYVGAITAFLSMSWFYTAHLKDSYSLLISVILSTRREYEKAYDVLCKLCSVLLKHGKLENISDLVTVESRVQYVLSSDSYQPKSVPCISGFCFGAAVRKMQAMLASWNQNNSSDWMIWKRLCNAAWTWNASMDIFESKELNFSTPILRKRSNRARGISIDIKNMHALKDEKIQNLNPDRYFSKDRFQLFLRIIIQRIAAELAQKHTEVYDNDEIYVHAMELEKTGNELWIKIEWKEGLSIEQFCLKSNIQQGR